jgi:hypothetical protein
VLDRFKSEVKKCIVCWENLTSTGDLPQIVHRKFCALVRKSTKWQFSGHLNCSAQFTNVRICYWCEVLPAKLKKKTLLRKLVPHVKQTIIDLKTSVKDTFCFAFRRSSRCEYSVPSVTSCGSTVLEGPWPPHI